MNEDLKRIWTTYLIDKTFLTPYPNVYIRLIKIFYDEHPVYEIDKIYNIIRYKKYSISYHDESSECEFYVSNGGWHVNDLILGEYYVGGNYKYPAIPEFRIMIAQIEPRLEYFDYFKHKKIFHEFKDKRKLRIIYLTLRRKIPSLSIFLILSFVRVIDLGYIM